MSPKKPLTLSTAKRKSRISAKLAKKSEIAAKKLDKDVAKLKAKEFRESEVQNSATPDIVATQSWRLATHATTQLANTEQSTEQKSNSQSTTADIDNRHSTVQTASTDPEKTLLEQQQQENAAETQTTIIPKFQDYGSSESTHLGQGPHFDDTQPPLVTLSQLPEIGNIKQQIEPTALTVSMARTTLTQSVRPPIISTEQHHTPLSIDEQVTHQSIKEDAPAASISGKLHAHGEPITSLQWTVAEHQGQFGRLDIDPITGEWHYQLDNNAPNTDALAEGEHQTEQFTVTVSGPNGEQVSTVIVIDVEGSNDLPQILGSHLASINAADALQTVMGQLRSVDPDHNDVITWAVLDGQGQYGQLSINPLTGQWQYQLNNHANATLALVSGQQVTETFTVTATDQSGHPVSQQVSIQVNGADDAAIIQGEMTGLVTEDTQAINGQLTVSGQLSIQDPDKDQAHFSADSLQGQFGYLTIDVNGHWIYNADNTQATIQSLRSGEHLTDTFIIHSADGTAQNITVTINGTDDKAEISGTTSASLTEDSDTYQGMLRANGNLTITDNDHGPHLFTATEQSGQFGTLTIDELGHWTYIADNSQTAIQALKTGESITDTLVVQTQDGTQQTISITINGTDDHSVIRGTSVVRVFEDKRLSQGRLHTDGQLWVSNPDTGRAGFAAEQRQGQFGLLSINSDGHWTYIADNNNPSIQALKHGEFVTETLFVKALDGTTQKIEILIKGADDKAIIGGTDTATLVEDQSVQHGQLQAHGTLTITDPDAGQAQFAALTDVTGSAGYGHFSIDATGNWTYTANNTLTAIQQLNTGEHLTDSLTISSADGTNHTLTVTITGSNDAPVVTHSLVTTTATEDTAFSFSIPAGTFADIDTGDTLIFSTGSLPAWLHFDAATGTFSGTPTNGDVGTSQVTITATDGSGAQVSTIFVLNVGNTNDAPTLTHIATVNATEDGAQVTGQFTATDPDSGDTLTFSIAQPVDGLTVNTDGSWRFDPSHASYQHLAAGQTLTLTIPVTVADAAGATGSQDLVIKLNGSNDGATIGGISTGSAKEDNAQITTGQLSVADVDDGEAHFVAQTDTAGTYGHFSLSADGRWGYQLDNSMPEIQQLSEGMMLHENFNVHSADGTTHTITVDIVGTNDAPVLSAQRQSVSEDGAKLSGQMVATDVDTGDSQTFSTSAQTAGFTLNADGSYSFDPTDAAYQHLATGQTETLTIPITVTDSSGATSTANLTITLTGSNDGAVISGTNASAVTEDTQLTTQGQLTVTDIDDQESAFTAQANTAGSYGSFTLAADGHWTYTLDNKNSAVQALGQNATLTDSLTVQSVDGTTHTITVTINGHDDGAVIAGVDSGTVTEDANLTAGQLETHGQLTISDPDAGQDHFTAQTNVAGSYGTFSLDADGQWHYSADNSQTAIQQLKAGATLTDSFTVTSADGTNHTVTVTLTGSNDAPVLTAQSQSVMEDGSRLSGQMVATDVDQGDTLHFSIGTRVAGFTLNADGSYNFDPSNAAYQHLAAGQTQTLAIPVTVTDSAGATSTANLTITLTGTNDGATLTDHGTPGQIKEDLHTAIEGHLSVRDVDSGEGLFPAQQGAGLSGYGSFILTPQANGQAYWRYSVDNSKTEIQQLGEGQLLHDSFTVHSADGTTHTVTVTLTGTNDVPVLTAQSQSVTEDGSLLTGQMAATDVDTGDSQTFSTTAQTAGFTLNADGSYSFEPIDAAYQHLAQGQTETLTIPVSVTDSAGATATQLLVITVSGSNDGAVISGTDAGTVTEDTQITTGGQLTVTDIDDQESAFTAQANTAGSYGSFTLAADGHWTYTLDNSLPAVQALGQNATLTDSLTVQSVDGTTHKVTVTINGHDDGALIAGIDSGTVTEDANLTAGQLETRGQLTITDPDAGQNHFTAQTNVAGSYGSFSLDADGQWYYSADNSQTAIQQLKAGETLTDSLNIQSVGGTTHTVTVTITGSNDAPVLIAQSQSVTEDGTKLSGQMVATDVDTGDTLTFSLANSVDGFTLNADGSYSFEPIDAAYQHLAQGQTETLTIPVSVTDSAGATATQQLVITVSGSNDGAVISGTDAGAVTEDTQLTTAGQLTVTDIDDQEAAFTAQTKAAGSYGSFTLAADGHWTYTLDNTNPTVQALSQTGTLTDSLTVQSVDGTTHQITVTINGHDDGAVIAGVDSGTVTEDANLTADQLETHGKLTITDPDTGQDHFTAQTNVAGSYGTFSLDADGQWHYSADNSQTAIQQLKAGETLTDSITVQSVGGTTHTVTITINGHDDGAVIAGVDSGTVTEDANLTAGQLETHGQLTISDPDAGQDHFTAQTNVAGSYGTFSLDADGQWRYSADNSQSAIQQLKAGETLTDSFTVTSADGTNHAVTVTLTGSNDAPVLTAQSQSVTEDGAKLTGQMVVTDVDTGDTLSFSLANGVDGFTLNTDGSYSFDPASAAYQHLAQGQTETLTIPITVTDSTGATSTANLTITLTGTNDGATISGGDTGRVIEDQNVDTQGLLHASGQLQIQDADAGQSNFVAQNGVATQYGHFSIDAQGAWSYTVDNNKPEVQALKPGGTPGETGNMAQALGQALVQSTMEGFHAVGEALTQGQSGALAGVLDLTVQGAAIVLSGPSGTTPVVYAMDAQGRSTLGVDELLSWLHQGAGYEVHLQGSQSDVQFFVHDRGDMGVLHGLPLSGATMLTDPENAAVHLALAWQTPPLPGVLSEVVSVISAEGTTHQITLSIQGTAEDAVISGTDSGTVTEDQNLNAAHQLEARGQLQVTDADAGQAVFQPIQDLAGHYGHLSLDKNGAWVYQADNNSRAVQALVKGQTVSDSFVVHSFDGTAHTISVALQGADDAYLDVMAHVANSLFNQLDPWPAIGGAISSGNIANLSGLELSFTGGTPTVVAADGHVLESFTHQDSFGTHIPLGHLVELIKSHPGSQLILEGTPGASSSFYVNNSGNPQQLDYAGSAKYDVAIRTLGSVPNHSLLNPHGSAAVLAGADGGSVLVDGDAQLQTQGHLTVLDADGDQAHFTAQQDVKGQYGQFSIDAQGLWHYQADGHQSALLLLAAGKSLSENFTVTSADGTSHTVTVQLFGSSQRTAATISGVDSGTLTEDTAQAQVSGQLSVVDPDAGEAHFIALADAKGRHGHFSLDEQGAWQYRLDNTDPAVQALKAGETLTDTLMVHSADGSSHELHITVQGSNDAPVLQAQSQSVTEDGSVLRGQMVAQDVDHGDALNFSTSSTTAGFVLHDDGSYTFDPANTAYQHLAAGQTQKLTIPITVTDSEGASDTENLIITITGRNDVPKVSQVEVLTASREDAVFVLSKAQLLAHVSDVDGDNLSITNITSDHGSLVSHRDGSYTFTPAANYNGQVTFHYDLVDGHGGRVSQTATMMLSAAPDAAIISGQDSGSVTEDQHVLRGKLSTGGILSVTDPDGAAESRLIPTGTTAGSLISGDKGLGQFEVGANGHWNFVANNADPRIQALGRHDALQDTITVHSVDGTAHTITVTINGTNDAPTLAAQSKSVAENGAQLSGRMVATDVDTGDTQAFSTTAKISGFTLHADGSYTFDPSDAAYQHLAQGQTQTLTIPVEVRDGSGATATNNLTIQITGTNDRPQITGVTTPHTVINIDGGASGGGFSIVDGVVHAGAHQRVWQASDYAALSHNAHGSNSVGDIFVFSDAATVHGADGGGSVGRDPKDYIVLDKPASAYRITSSANHVDSGTNYGNVQVTEIATGKSWGTANNIEDIIFGDGTSYSGKSSVQKTTSEVAMPNLNGVLTVVEGGPRLTGHIQASDVDSGDTRTFSTSAHVAGFTLNSDGSFSFNPADAAYHHLAQGHKLSLDIPVVATDKHGTSDQRVLHLEITGIDDSAVRSTRPAPPAPQAPSTDAEQHAGIVEDAHHQAGQSDLSNHAASTLPSSTDSTDESHDSVPVFTKVVTNEQGGTGSPLADYLHFADTSQHVDLGGAADGTAVSPLADYLGPYTFGELQLHAQTSSQSSDEANFETIDSVNLDVAEPATVATSAHDLDSASSGHLNVSSVNYDASLLMGSVDEQTAQTNPAQDKSVDTTLFEGGNFSAQATTSPIDHYLQMVGLMPNSIEQQPTAPIELATLNTPSSTFQEMDTDMLDMVTINHFENPLIEEHKTPHLDQYGFQGEHAQLEVNPNDDDLLHSALNDMHNQM
ncbi:VCBS domain-containing protein [Shewanella xiamenensis]|uniref:VCBS domain-containing protein n=1 Tax=Shewanella xiamenensis TaxID=332186 RepID=UPI002E7AC583|nr:VCBS domain-containing protein [Shewanella xiamenensis]MEE1981949.1 VCBS domain-containing protein [Shewanella xiamenensis]